MSKLDEIRKSVAENRAKNNGIYIPEGASSEEIEKRIAEEKSRKEAEELAQQIRSHKSRIIVTTTPYVEGRTIKQYRGLVSGADIYNAGGLLGGGYTTAGQTNLYQMAVSLAVDKMMDSAALELADAIIGVQISLGSSSSMNQVIVTATGTAVRLEPTTDSDE